MDVRWSRCRLDQYEDNSRCSILCPDYANGSRHASVWLGFDATYTCASGRHVSRRAAAAITLSYDTSVLTSPKVCPWANFSRNCGLS